MCGQKEMWDMKKKTSSLKYSFQISQKKNWNFETVIRHCKMKYAVTDNIETIRTFCSWLAQVS